MMCQEPPTLYLSPLTGSLQRTEYLSECWKSETFKDVKIQSIIWVIHTMVKSPKQRQNYGNQKKKKKSKNYVKMVRE